MIPISNAKDKDQNFQSLSLPNVGDGIRDLFQPIQIGIVSKSMIDGFLNETVTKIDSVGFRLPASPETITLKPEGQRSWRWEQLHCLSDTDIPTDTIIEIKGIRYRVMGRQDFTEYGYLVYDITQDFIEQ